MDLAWNYSTRVVGVREGKIVYDVQMKDMKKSRFFADLEKVYGRPITNDEILGDE